MNAKELKIEPLEELAAETLFHPISKAQFLGEIYGKQHYIFKGEKERFAALLSWQQANEILHTHQLVYPRLRLSRDGAILDKTSYQKGADIAIENGARPVLRGAAFHQEVRKGATVIIDYINEICRPIQDIVELLESVFQVSVQANAYLTQSSRTGFGTHWDSHDVFALQVHGRKYWRIFGPTVLHPLKADNQHYKERPTEPIWEGFLNAGEILYLPRGCWHDAQAKGEESIHLSFGVHHKTGCDFAEWGLRELKQSLLMRKDLPRSMDKKQLQAYQAEMVAEVVKCLSREDLYHDYLRYIDSRKMPASYHLNLPYIIDPSIKELPPGSKIRLARRKKYLVETLPNGAREILALEKKWKFPPEVFGIIEMLMVQKYLTIETIEEELLPHQYSRLDIHAFALGLIRKGFFAIAD